MTLNMRSLLVMALSAVAIALPGNPLRITARQATGTSGIAQTQTSFEVPSTTSTASSTAATSTSGIEQTQTSFDTATFTTATNTSSSSAATATGNSTGLAGVTGVDGNITSWAYLWGWHDCSNSQKAAVLDGLSEAHTVLGAQGVYYIDSHWNDFATVEYLGSPWYAKQSNRQAGIKNNFDKAYSYQQSWFSWYDTQVFCLADTVGYCANEPSYIAVENNFDKNGLALGFCDRYFQLGTLQGIYNEASSGGNPYDLSEYENRARAWITTMMRINWIAGLVPQKVRYPGQALFNYVESASQTKYLAKNSGDAAAASKTLNNPSNYAWYAMAQWVQQKSGNYPQRPQTPDELSPGPFTLTNLTSTTD